MNRDSNNTQAKQLTGQEIAKHNTKDDCWVIVQGKAYDVTECKTLPAQETKLV